LVPDKGFSAAHSTVSVLVRQSPYDRSDFAELTAIRPCQARYVMFGLPVLADCYTRPRGAVVLRSSTPCTSAYLTELRSTLRTFRRPHVLSRATVIFRFLTSSVSVFARQSPNGRPDLADLTAIRPCQARYVMFGPPVLADCYTKPRGAVVLRSSTVRTSAYLTELWPTYAYRPEVVLGTSVFDRFGPRLCIGIGTTL
jgi:hypothetical protein